MFLGGTSPILNSAQRELIDLPVESKIFLEGPAGSGKTTAAVNRLLYLMAEGVAASSILIFVPQRTLAEPYQQALEYPGVLNGGLPTVLTPGGLAQRMVDLFWPLVGQAAGFAHPEKLPIFLTLETAQYYMAHVVQPLLAEGFFDSVAIGHNRLYSQILDNLNKAAVVGFPHTEIGERLQAAWVGDPGQLRIYADVQECAILFRRFCLEHNLLDFSLQVEIFRDILWPGDHAHPFLQQKYKHVIFDNLEEDTPWAHDLIREWLPDLNSALLIYDWLGGFRRFLGADPDSALSLREVCKIKTAFPDQLIMSPEIAKLSADFTRILQRNKTLLDEQPIPPGLTPRSAPLQNLKKLREIVHFEQHRFYPQMLDWVADQIAHLIHTEGYQPADIAVLSPFLPDGLRFSLVNRLQIRNIPVRTHRPSRALRDEPVTLCLLTLSALAYPEWEIQPTRVEIVHALTQAIDGMDLVRAHILVGNTHRLRAGKIELGSFYDLKPAIQNRITFRLGERYEYLRQWLKDRRDPPDEFDHFLSRLFGEILSQPGFGFHDDYQPGEVTANLIESIQKFRWVAGDTLTENGTPLGQEYLHMVQEGVIAAQYIRSWQNQPDQGVFIAPAFTFLMANQSVKAQFWLDVGSRGWTERLEQPLTHPYVLSRRWPVGRLWRDIDEVETGQQLLFTLVQGLLSHCQERIYLGLSELSEQGYENRGALLQAFQRLFLSVER